MNRKKDKAKKNGGEEVREREKKGSEEWREAGKEGGKARRG